MKRSLLASIVFICAVSAVSQEMKIPRLTQYATDLTGTLSPGEISSLNAKLRQFDQTTSSQIVVLMVPTIGTGSLEDITMKVAEANTIGQKGKDNGILLFIAKDDRRVRIEVGYGLEGALPDITAGQIIRNEIGPPFRQGNYAAGVNAGVDAIILATNNEYKAKAPESGRGSSGGIKPLILIVFILFFLLRVMFRRRFLGGFGPFFGGWGGGGWGGGGGGGFSGGGGSFGGGGASGSW